MSESSSPKAKRPPERAPRSAQAFAGHFVLAPPAKPGVYKVTISSPGWIDVIDGDSYLHPKSFTGATDCEGARKSVKFDLPSRPLALQFSGVSVDAPGERPDPRSSFALQVQIDDRFAIDCDDRDLVRQRRSHAVAIEDERNATAVCCQHCRRQVGDDRAQVIHRGMRINPRSEAAKAGSIPGVRTPIFIDGAPMAAERPAPRLGEHTAEILREIGEG